MTHIDSFEHKETKYIFEPPVQCVDETIDSLAMLSARALVGTGDYAHDIAGVTEDIAALFTAIDDNNPDYLSKFITSLLSGNRVGYVVTYLSE